LKVQIEVKHGVPVAGKRCTVKSTCTMVEADCCCLQSRR
jgi:hypothetical protein